MHIQNLINTIRRFTTTSVVYGGVKYLCDFNKGELKLNERAQILLGYYGHKIIALGLLETSDFIHLTSNNKSICYLENFIELCEQYLGALSYSQYGWNTNPQDFIDALIKDTSQKNKSISPEYLQKDMSIISKACNLNALMQVQNSQTSKIQFMRVTQTYVATVTALENQNIKDIDVINKIKDVDPTKLLRSGWILCAIALQRNGIVDFANIPGSFKYKHDVDKESCLKIANKLSEKGNLNNLKKEWRQINSGLITQNTNQKLISFLQNIPSIICTEQDTFLIPCRTAYLELLGTYILTALASRNNEKECEKIKSKIGDAIESHIKMALEHIFGNENVKKISESKDNNADFHITLDNCDLIIEVKRSIGYATTIKSTARTWHRLNGAYRQCANSIKECKTGTKPIIAIIIIFEEDGLTPASFQVFAEQSKLASDLGIEYIKIMSWYDLESILSRTSVSQFIATLLKNKNRYDDPHAEVTVAEAIYHSEFSSDAPAHSYQYLHEAENTLNLPRAISL